MTFVGVLAQTGTNAQLRVQPVLDQRGEVALGLSLRKLRTVGSLMMTTAHPDDENNGLLSLAGHGMGWRTTLLSATRGDGGQNEIGPELFDALAVLRTEELLAAHRFDGAEQYFTRAVDFGFSFSIDETFEKWGKDEILADFVRHIRTIRPDVIIGFVWDGPGGGQHHQASARLTAEAFRAAADPQRFPEQIREGLRPWQARKFYYTAGFGPATRQEPANILVVNSDVFDPVLGRSHGEVSAEARSMHKCQGMGQILPLAGMPDVRRYVLQDTVLEGGSARQETTVFDGIDASLSTLGAYAGPAPPAALGAALVSILDDVSAAEKGLAEGGLWAAARPLASGLSRVRGLRKALPTLGLSNDAVFEIDFRLAQKEKQFEDALVLANGFRIDAIADDGLVVPGQAVSVLIRAAARAPEAATLKGPSLQGFANGATCDGGETANGRPYECKIAAVVPATAALTTPYFRRLPDAARYVFEPDAPFGLPFRPTPFRASVDISLSGETVHLDVPVQFRYEGNIFSGEKRMDLLVVPNLAVRVTPTIGIVPVGVAPERTATRKASSRELRVTVTNQTKGPAKGEARLDVPAGWAVTPSSAPVTFAREDEQMTVRFTVRPTTRQSGEFDFRAVVRLEGVDYDRGYQVIEYPHTHRQHLVEAAHVRMKVLDVAIAPALRVGYVMGVGDLVPPAIEQLGATVDLLGPDELAWGDLTKYDVLVTGVRAYERRPDLRAYNQRLLDFAERGGTVLVQYNKFEFNDAQYGPYPAKVSGNRVTDERAPITPVDPTHPVFTTPNRIEASAWDGWVQERGLYFLGERDQRYVDLVRTADTFAFNAGPKAGALVEARVGKGRWIYVGLNLWRQLPAGTPGAYRLMANLLSLGKRPAGSPVAQR